MQTDDDVEAANEPAAQLVQIDEEETEYDPAEQVPVVPVRPVVAQ